MMTSPTAMVTTSTPSIPFRISAGGGGAGLVQSAATVLIVVRGGGAAGRLEAGL